MNRHEADDARFQELMAREFPGGLLPAGEPDAHRVRPPGDEPGPSTGADPDLPTGDEQGRPGSGGPSPAGRPDRPRHGASPDDGPHDRPTEPRQPPRATDAAPAAPVAEPSPARAPGFRDWAPAEEPEEPFVPPPAPPARPWSAAGIAGTALVALPMLLVFAAALGVRFPMLVSVLAGLGFFVGIVLLLHRLRQRPPIDGDGAVV